MIDCCTEIYLIIDWFLYRDLFNNWLIVVQRIDTVRVHEVFKGADTGPSIWVIHSLIYLIIDWLLYRDLFNNWLIVVQRIDTVRFQAVFKWADNGPSIRVVYWFIYLIIDWLLYRGLTPYVCMQCLNELTTGPLFEWFIGWFIYWLIDCCTED